MEKLTVIGDPHAKHVNLDLINELFDKAEEIGNDVVWMGDFLDTKEVIRGKCSNLIYRRLKMSRLNHYILIGNHDYFNLDCEDHALQFLKELNNVKIIDSYQEHGGMGFMPYVHDQEKLKKIIKNSKVDVLFGHFELKGFDFGNGYICEKGLTGRSFSKFKRVISGHFHKYQQKGNLTYLGTPFSHSFGESNQDKYLGTYHVVKDHLELIPSGFPQHMTCEINCDEESSIGIFRDNDILRIILKGTQDNINRLTSKGELPAGAKIIERPSDDFQSGVEIEETLDNQVKFNTWAKDIRGLDKETIELGLEILEAVK